MRSNLVRDGLYGIARLALALSLLPGPAHALTIVSEEVLTGASIPSQADPKGPADGPLESYVEEQNSSLNYTWFASAKAGADMVNQVGVDLTQPICCTPGDSSAHAFQVFRVTNDSDQAVEGARASVVIPDGEVLFRLGSFTPRAGQSAEVLVEVFAEGVSPPIFQYALQLVTTDGGFEEARSTANVGIDLVFQGQGGDWGYQLLGGTFDFDLPSIPANGELLLTHQMWALGSNPDTFGEFGAGFSAKLGDPLTLLPGASLQLVPEPRALVLLGLGLAALGVRRARGRAARRAAAGLLVLLPLLGASEARAQACGNLSEATPLALLADYLETLGGLFPLDDAECEKLTQAAVSACHKVISRLESCAGSEIAGSRKMAKTGCSAQGAGEDACNADFDALLDALESGVDANADSAHAACDQGFATQLALACAEGIL